MKLSNSFLLFLIIAIFGCSSRQINQVGLTYNELTSSTWQLKSMNGVEVEPESYSKGLPELHFAEDGKMTGSTGCNQFMGTYIMDEAKLEITTGAMTKMACPGAGEVEFVNGLSRTVQGSIEENMLHLKEESGKVHMILNQMGNHEKK